MVSDAASSQRFRKCSDDDDDDVLASFISLIGWLWGNNSGITSVSEMMVMVLSLIKSHFVQQFLV